MIEFRKGIEELLDACVPWEVVSVTKQEQAEGRIRGVVTIELVVRKGQLVPCPKWGGCASGTTGSGGSGITWT